MPLHLLGKKSWNVYNADNIARVRRDEEAAAAAEAAAEQSMQENDAARRTAILRGETPPPLLDPPRAEEACGVPRASNEKGRDEQRQRPKRRKLRGEDDTDRDIRWAREDAQQGQEVKSRLSEDDKQQIAITDRKGHIQLFNDPEDAHDSKRAERVRKDAEHKRKEEEQMTGMRFSHAAGYNASKSGPWYATKDKPQAASQDVVGKNAFGHDDPNRNDRDAKRVASSDPMAMMRQAQVRLKQAEKDKLDRQEKQRTKTKQLDEEAATPTRRKHRRRSDRDRRRSHHGSDDSLEGFALDAPSAVVVKDRDRRRRHHRHQHDESSERRRSHDRHSNGRRRSRSPKR